MYHSVEQFEQDDFSKPRMVKREKVDQDYEGL